MKTQIVKLQVPLMGEPLALVYNKNRSYIGHVPINDDIKEAMGESFKKYFIAHIDKKGLVHLHKEVEEQDW